MSALPAVAPRSDPRDASLLPLAACAACPLCPPLATRPSAPVYGAGATDPVVVVIGEAPGATEVARGEPFVGPSGRLLWQTLTRRHRGDERPASVYATNALLCPTPVEKPVSPKSIRACRERLLHELSSLDEPPRVILCVGAKAIEALHGKKASVSEMNGRAVWSEQWQCWIVYAYHPAAVLRNADLYQDFQYAVDVARQHIKASRGPAPVEEIRYTVADASNIERFLADANRQSVSACDLETTGLDPYRDHILEIGLCWDREHAWILPLDVARQHLDRVRALLERRDILWIYHNGKFDVQMLSGLDIDARVGADTMLMHHCLDERSGGEGGGFHDLKRLATKYVGAPHYAEGIDGEHMSSTPPDVRHRYHANDLIYTRRLYDVLSQALDEQPPSRFGYPMPRETHDRLLIPAANALADMELRGIRIDVMRLLALHDEYDQMILDARHRATVLANQPTFNPNSTLQVARVLRAQGYPHLRSTAEAVIHELQRNDVLRGRPHNELLDVVLEYRSLLHTRSTYIRGIGKHTALRGAGDRRLRTNILLHGTVTGRTASRYPNLQNIPKDSVLREMFVPSAGHTFVDADYKNLEVRVLAWYSRDPQLIATVREADVHWATAARMWPTLTRDMLNARAAGDLAALEDLCRQHSMFSEFVARQQRPNERTDDPETLFGWMKTRIRRQGKYVTFGVMYREGAESLSGTEKGLGVPKATAQQFIDSWRATYAIAYDFLDQQARLAKRHRWIESASGRRRRFPYPDLLAIGLTNEAVNFPIQARASDINLEALVQVHARLTDLDLGAPLLPIHDSILSEVRTERLDEGCSLIKQTMTSVLPDDEVFFDVDLHTGANWAICS